MFYRFQIVMMVLLLQSETVLYIMPYYMVLINIIRSILYKAVSLSVDQIQTHCNNSESIHIELPLSSCEQSYFS
jgi:hypothetical protein